MSTVASRDLRNHTADVLKKVAEGTEVTVTVHGRPVALITRPHSSRPTHMSKEEFFTYLQEARADAGLTDELTWISSDTTDDLEPLE